MTKCITVSEMVGGGTKANDFRVAKGKFLPFLAISDRFPDNVRFLHFSDQRKKVTHNVEIPNSMQQSE